jgi:transposase-like protein
VKRRTQTNTRRRFSPTEKSKILKLHLVEGRPISDVCEEYGITPSQFYGWQALLFQNSERVFDRNRGPRPSASEEKIKRLEAKIGEKDQVIAELMAEYLKAKKRLGRTRERTPFREQTVRDRRLDRILVRPCRDLCQTAGSMVFVALRKVPSLA